MKRTLAGISAFAVLTIAATSAQAQTVTFESTIGPPTLVGGLGEDDAIGGAYWTSTATVKSKNKGEPTRTSTSTANCVGMNQPSGSLYDRHVTCTSKSENAVLSIVMGCMKGEEGSGEMTCTGYVDGKSGKAEGHQGLITQHYKFNLDGSGGTSTGTGQWTK